MHEFTADDDPFVLIKDGFGNTFYLNRLHMLDLALRCIVFYAWYARPIYLLSHSDILLQDWRVFHDFIINCMEDFLYRLTRDVLNLPYTISPFFIAGGVYFILSLHLWYWGM